ncbi:MAG: hypothetical protein A2136_09140 [Chloroflexi bacterium RBG_16_54_11]|nr:MAG: hypothetical protein A2136_09140 [Chloroflexi bacterium RBG_16_54_11]
MQDELISTQESAVPENLLEPTAQETTPRPIFTFPPITSLWRRLFAWLVDVLIIGIIGILIGAVFGSYLRSIGPYGRLIGLIVVICYFGIQNSKIGHGQTLGKKLLKIAVRDKNDQYISFGRSVVRILIIYVPVLVNGWSLPIFQNRFSSWLLSVLLFGLGGAILYTMVFNRITRQGLHDLLLGTYVVYLPGEPVETYPTSSRLHWTVSGVWIGIVALGTLVITIIAPSIISKTPLESVNNLYDLLQEDPRFFTVGVTDQTSFVSDGRKSRALVITAWYKGEFGEEEGKQIIDEIAKIVLENASDIDRYDGMQVTLTSAFDLGIASGHYSIWFAHSIEDWRKETYPANAPLGLFSALGAGALALP